MLRRLAARFGPEAAGRGDTLLDLIISDYLAYYGPTTPMRARWGVAGARKNDSPLKLALMFIPRLVHNVSLHATVLLRLASRSPYLLVGFWRTVLISKHSIDIQRGLEIGPGLLLPHPLGIVFGWGVRIGAGVTILNNIVIGGNPQYPPGASRFCPVIGDDNL